MTEKSPSNTQSRPLGPSCLDNGHIMSTSLQYNFLRGVSTRKKRHSQPGPVYYSPIQRSSTCSTTDRVYELLGLCAVHDSHHRVIISHETYWREASNNKRKDGRNAPRDFINLLLEATSSVDIPDYALNNSHSYANYKPSSKWRNPVLLVDIIVFLFRPIFSPRIDDIDTDLLHNPISLATVLHSLFGDICIFISQTPTLKHLCKCGNQLEEILRFKTCATCRKRTRLRLRERRIQKEKDNRCWYCDRKLGDISHKSCADCRERHRDKRKIQRDKERDRKRKEMDRKVAEWRKAHPEYPSREIDNESNRNVGTDLNQSRVNQGQATDKRSKETQDKHPPKITEEGQSENNQDQKPEDVVEDMAWLDEV